MKKGLNLRARYGSIFLRHIYLILGCKFVSNLDRNSEDRFSHDKAKITICHMLFVETSIFQYCTFDEHIYIQGKKRTS